MLEFFCYWRIGGPVECEKGSTVGVVRAIADGLFRFIGQ
jgi:hypothetical protein